MVSSYLTLYSDGLWHYDWGKLSGGYIETFCSICSLSVHKYSVSLSPTIASGVQVGSKMF